MPWRLIRQEQKERQQAQGELGIPQPKRYKEAANRQRNPLNEVRALRRSRLFQDGVAQDLMGNCLEFEAKLKACNDPELITQYKIYIATLVHMANKYSPYNGQYTNFAMNKGVRVSEASHKINSAFGSTGNLWMTTPFAMVKTSELSLKWRQLMAFQNITLMVGTFLNMVKTTSNGISSCMYYGLLREFNATLEKNIIKMGTPKTKEEFERYKRESMPKIRELIDSRIRQLRIELEKHKSGRRIQQEGREGGIAPTSDMIQAAAVSRERTMSGILSEIRLLEQYKSVNFMMDKQKNRIFRNISNFIFSIPKMLGFMIICSTVADFVGGAFVWSFGQVPADLLRGARALRKKYRNYAENKIDEHIMRKAMRYVIKEEKEVAGKKEVERREVGFMTEANGYGAVKKDGKIVRTGNVRQMRFSEESINYGLLKKYMGVTEDVTLDDKKIINALLKGLKGANLSLDNQEIIKELEEELKKTKLDEKIRTKLLAELKKSNPDEKVINECLGANKEIINRLLEGLDQRLKVELKAKKADKEARNVLLAEIEGELRAKKMNDQARAQLLKELEGELKAEKMNDQARAQLLKELEENLKEGNVDVQIVDKLLEEFKKPNPDTKIINECLNHKSLKEIKDEKIKKAIDAKIKAFKLDVKINEFLKELAKQNPDDQAINGFLKDECLKEIKKENIDAKIKRLKLDARIDELLAEIKKESPNNKIISDCLEELNKEDITAKVNEFLKKLKLDARINELLKELKNPSRNNETVKKLLEELKKESIDVDAKVIDVDAEVNELLIDLEIDAKINSLLKEFKKVAFEAKTYTGRDALTSMESYALNSVISKKLLPLAQRTALQKLAENLLTLNEEQRRKIIEESGGDAERLNRILGSFTRLEGRRSEERARDIERKIILKKLAESLTALDEERRKKVIEKIGGDVEKVNKTIKLFKGLDVEKIKSGELKNIDGEVAFKELAEKLIALGEGQRKKIIEESGGDAERLNRILESFKEQEFEAKKTEGGEARDISREVEESYAKFMYNRTRDLVEREFQTRSKIYARLSSWGMGIDRMVELETFRRLCRNEAYFKAATGYRYKEDGYDAVFTDAKKKPLICRLGVLSPDVTRSSRQRLKMEKEEVRKVVEAIGHLWNDTRFLGLERFMEPGIDLKNNPEYQRALRNMLAVQELRSNPKFIRMLDEKFANTLSAMTVEDFERNPKFKNMLDEDLKKLLKDKSLEELKINPKFKNILRKILAKDMENSQEFQRALVEKLKNSREFQRALAERYQNVIKNMVIKDLFSNLKFQKVLALDEELKKALEGMAVTDLINNPKFQEALKNMSIRDWLNGPKFQEVLASNDELKKALESITVADLINNPKLINKPKFQEALKNMLAEDLENSQEFQRALAEELENNPKFQKVLNERYQRTMRTMTIKDLENDVEFKKALKRELKKTLGKEEMSVRHLANMFRNEQELYSVQLRLKALFSGNGIKDADKYLWKIMNIYKTAKDKAELDARLGVIEDKLLEELHHVGAQSV